MTLPPHIVPLTATVRPDGTLVIDQPIPLVPGRVLVTLQTIPETTKRGLAEVIDEIQQQQLARGYTGRTVEEMKADEETKQREEEEYDWRIKTVRAQTLPGSMTRD